MRCSSFTANKGAFVLTLFLLIVTNVYIFTLHSVNIEDRLLHESLSRISSRFKQWEECIQNVIMQHRTNYREFWHSAFHELNACESSSGLSAVQPTVMQNNEDDKYHIIPADNKKPSVIVSLGVGRNVGAEERMKKLLAPSTTFFGADPVETGNRQLYSKIGRFFNYAVGWESGVVETRVLLPKDKTKYTTLKVPMKELGWFLETQVVSPFIDHLIVDIEGSEWSLLPAFQRGSTLDQRNITVCQINIEFHAPSLSQKQRFFDFFSLLLFDRQYFFGKIGRLYIPDDPYGQPVDVVRVYLYNRDHPYCVRRYLTQFF